MPTLQCDAQTLDMLQQFYKPHLKETTPAHSIFSASYNGVTITAYKSGKVLFQGKNAEKEANQWQSISTVPTEKKNSSVLLPKGFENWAVIGSDEVGTGSYFGSLTVCAVFLDDALLSWAKHQGVKDSKQLNDDKIIALAKTLRERIPYVLLDVLPEKYNAVQPTMSQGEMKAKLHNDAIRKLLHKIKPIEPDAILIDQFELPKTYFNHIKDQALQIKERVYFATKGESHHLSVAAASIIARAKWLETLQTLSETIGTTLPSGAGDTVDAVAAKLIAQHGQDVLKKLAKWHFSNTKKALKLAQHQ